MDLPADPPSRAVMKQIHSEVVEQLASLAQQPVVRAAQGWAEGVADGSFGRSLVAGSSGVDGASCLGASG